MSEFDQIFRCTLGGTDFQLEDLTWSESPRIKRGVGRFGTSVRVDGTGWMEAASASDFATKLGATAAAFRVSGEDFRVFGLGGNLYRELLAAQVNDGGPFVGFEELPGIGDSGAGLKRHYRFTVEAETGTDFGGDPVEPGFEERWETRADGLHVVTRSGQLEQSNVTQHFLGAILPAFRLTFPTPPWIVTHEYTVDEPNRVLSYRITATEHRAPLPNLTVALAGVRDGEGVYRKQRDEQLRLREIYEWDLLIKGDWTFITDTLRSAITAAPPLGQGRVIIREQIDVTLFREVRLHAVFEVLSGAELNDLLDWNQSVAIDSGPAQEELNYLGAGPLLARGEERFIRVTQAGRAVGAGRWPIEAAPLVPAALVEQRPVQFNLLDVVQRETSWSYVMAVGSATIPSILAQNRRPINPAFYP